MKIITFIMAQFGRLWRFWMADIGKRGCLGKVVSLGVGLFAILCTCVGMSAAVRTSGRAVGTVTPTSDSPNYALLTSAALPPSTATTIPTTAPTATDIPTATTAPAAATPTSKPTAKPVAPQPTNVPQPTQAPQPTSAPQPTQAPQPTDIPSAPIAPAAANFDTNGDGKVTCADFKTKAEATVALKAGYTNLDRNNDGVPCESLP
jgi:outer membrane biosynthesis protein TonB